MDDKWLSLGSALVGLAGIYILLRPVAPSRAPAGPDKQQADIEAGRIVHQCSGSVSGGDGANAAGQSQQ